MPAQPVTPAEMYQSAKDLDESCTIGEWLEDWCLIDNEVYPADQVHTCESCGVSQVESFFNDYDWELCDVCAKEAEEAIAEEDSIIGWYKGRVL